MLYRNLLKRLLDFCIALIAFVLLLPVFIAVTILLFAANKGKPFFTQPRPGKGERVFRILKFKTMNDRRDANGQLLPDAERLTTAGSFIRKTSLDEIPQLLNVLKGDMSLIGPRPLLVDYLPLYNQRQRLRHTVRPGITGWAQVNGRNAIGWEQRFELDAWYATNLSLGLDLKIILLTIKKVVRAADINAPGVATVERFTGNLK
jgi:lipopolysaccharide/colanic/teichoic acid biosynthesis glycosyltransferase